MATLLEYKCPCCGGAIEFDPSIQKMKCPFCDTEFETETLRAYDDDLKGVGEDDMRWDRPAGGSWQEDEDSSLASYVCSSCGGEIICDVNTSASSCPYCGNPVVMTGNLKGELKPDLIIPFKLDKKAAREALIKHLKGKTLLPKIFRDENHIDEVKGVYVPFWLFDTDADASIRYKATKTRCWSDSSYSYTETSFFSVVRSGSIAFDAVPVDGSSKMADDLMESIEPFSLDGAVDFQTAYLAGYLADKYDVTSEESVGRANERIKRSTETAFANTVKGYTTVTPESASVRLSNGRAKYALYPVWILNTAWNDKKYTFAMNGQTGKFVGNLPLDKGALARWLFGLTAAVGAAVFAVSYLFWLL